MRMLFGSFMLLVSIGLVGAATNQNHDEIIADKMERANKLRAERSYALAREIYDWIILQKQQAPKAIRDAARVWGADSQWRERSNPENYEEARKKLDALVSELPDTAIRAEAAESLGDLLAESRPWQTAQQIVDAWTAAANFWANSTEPNATARYIAINFKLADFLVPRIQPLQPRGRRIAPQPGELKTPALEIVRKTMRDVLRITKNPADIAHAYLLLSRAYLQQANLYDKKDKSVDWRAEAEDYLRKACAVEPANEWTDDALFDLTARLETKQAYVEEVAFLHKFFDLYKPGQSQFYDNMKQRYDQTTTPSLQTQMDRCYAPGSYIHIWIQYRNLKDATFQLKRLDAEDFVKQFDKLQKDNEEGEMPGKVVQERTIEGLVDEGKYIPQGKYVFLDPLEPAVYQFVVKSPKLARPVLSQRFFVSGLAAAIKTDRDKAEMFVTDGDGGMAVEGAPVNVLVREKYYSHPPIEKWHKLHGTTDADGRASLDLPQIDPGVSITVFGFARRGGELAMANSGYYGYNRGRRGGDGVRIYAYTDRPAYRPGEAINWKAIARRDNGETFSLVDAAAYRVRIRDERGAIVHEAVYKLGEFGSFSGSFTLDRSAALGILNMEVLDEAGQQTIGYAQLCRLEEYKLPEYKVSVEPGKGPYRLGSTVPFSISAEYYFGGPVAGAKAEVVVYRSPFWRGWWPIMPYDWLYEGVGSQFSYGGKFGYGRHYSPEEMVLKQTVTLDATGKASVEIGALSDEEVKTARDNHYWGYSYRVEARVTDLSRREVSASGSIKIALTAFAGYLYPQRYLFLPGDKVKIDLTTLDPNDKPVAAKGTVTIYKREWVTGNAALPSGSSSSKSSNREIGVPGKYKDTELFKLPAETGDDGKTTIEFQPERDGYYYMKYNALDAFEQKVEAETTVFVAGKETTAIGYRSGGAEIIIDRTTYVQGETIQALVITRRPGVAVWLGVEGETIMSEQVLKMNGTAQLVPIKVEPSFTPNVYLTTMAMYDYSAFNDTKPVRVPPINELLEIKVIPDKTEYRPGEQASVRVEARDHDGKPVRGEISLSVADASVWAIQGDLAQDIRKFFWSRERPQMVSTMASPSSYQTVFWRPKKDKPGEFERVLREEIPGFDYDPTNGTMSSGDVYKYKGLMEESIDARGGVIGGVRGPGMKADGNTREFYAAAPMSLAAGRAETAKPQEPRVRTNFGSTAYWVASVVTDENGNADATFTIPDSLTTWRASSIAITKTTQVGQAAQEVKTNKPIMVRPQVPRYFVQGDRSTISAVITNNTTAPQRVHVRINATGIIQVFRKQDAMHGWSNKPEWEDESTSPVQLAQPEADILIPAKNQRRVDWYCWIADTITSTTIRMSALADVDSDAAEKTYPVLEYGIEKFIAKNTSIKSANTEIGVPGVTSRTLVLSIPAERRLGSEALTIWVEPTLAQAMVNALPYLAQYPYGCTEQTLSRFVPSVITAKTLQQLGIKNEELEKNLPDMIKAGLNRLYDFQHADGGWGWWKEGQSDPYMTAYVVQGLAQALDADVSVKEDVISRGADFLRKKLVEYQDAPDMAAWMLYALATVKVRLGEDQLTGVAHDRLWEKREELNPYTRALYALACHMTGRTERAQTLARNMMNGLIEDKQNGTASWGRSGFWWRWSDGSIEATAFSLRALLAIDPKNPVVDEAMTWLVRNRRGSRWESTKDTAIVIRALADYIRDKGEGRPDWSADVVVNGKTVKTLTVTPETVFSFDGKFSVPSDVLTTGDNTITFVRRGSGSLYASAWLTYFTREQKIAPAGNEVYAERKFYRTEMKPTPSGAYKQVRTELKEGDVLNSGDRVEVELNLEAKNNYEYIVIEDLKAAGMEPVELQSGGIGAGTLWGHREIRDEKNAFFVDSMPQGKHTIKYELRAEIPGTFHAQPCLVHAMYVPEIRANSSNAVIQIK